MKHIFTYLIILTSFFSVRGENLSNSPKSWMSFLKDETKISALSIPGTHDSGATSGGSLGQCQSDDIKTQLEAGVRFLDIRVKAVNGVLKVYHGIVSMNLSFEEDIMDICKTFLAENPGETILMSIKNEDGDKNDYMTLLEASLTSQDNQIGRAHV